jgi:acylphosphatase
MIEIRVIFIGQVQGVGFRFTTRSIAKKLGITGTVRNLPDGSVEMIAQGTPAIIDSLLHELKTQAFNGAIHKTREERRPVRKSFPSFEIIH